MVERSPRVHRRLAIPLALACLASLLLALLVPVLPPVAPVRADDTVTVTDVVGRTVTVKAPAERLILAEGRTVYLIALLEPGDPFKRIVGWPEDLKTADLDTYEKYRARFPQLDAIPVFGPVNAGSFSVEQAIALKPDVVVLNFDSYDKAQELGLFDQLAAAGIPTVVTDFRAQPLENTVPSVRLLAKLMGQAERAATFVDYYQRQLDTVSSRLAAVAAPKPTTFLYRAAGLLECCATFGKGNLGVLVERAGGRNLGSDFLPSWAGTLNPEQVLTADPDVVIVTGSNWTYSPGKIGPYVPMGYGTDAATSRAQLNAVVEGTPGWGSLKAVRNGRVHAIWHQFYNSPYHFVALQQFAKWLYPEEFRDVDPERNFREFHQQFLPIDYSGTFWVSLGN